MLYRQNVLCIQELNNTQLLHTHISNILHFHRLLQPCHVACSVQNCRILAVTFQFSLDTITFCMQHHTSRNKFGSTIFGATFIYWRGPIVKPVFYCLQHKHEYSNCSKNFRMVHIPILKYPVKSAFLICACLFKRKLNYSMKKVRISDGR
jgi:hypothetical protein